MADISERPEAMGSAAGDSARSRGGGAAALASEMRTLSGMIEDLEAQLDRMLATNEALKRDLDQEREARADLDGTLDGLRENLERSEGEAAEREGLTVEVNHLNQERTRLATTVTGLEQRLADTQKEVQRQALLTERLRSARADAVEDVQSTEAQFEGAMQMVADLRTQLLVMTEERDTVTGRLRMTADQLSETRQERDGLLSDFEESRASLDEIRRSLAEACLSPADATPSANKIESA